jgi:hypothetical protein
MFEFKHLESVRGPRAGQNFKIQRGNGFNTWLANNHAFLKILAERHFHGSWRLPFPVSDKDTWVLPVSSTATFPLALCSPRGISGSGGNQGFGSSYMEESRE